MISIFTFVQNVFNPSKKTMLSSFDIFVLFSYLFIIIIFFFFWRGWTYLFLFLELSLCQYGQDKNSAVQYKSLLNSWLDEWEQYYCKYLYIV